MNKHHRSPIRHHAAVLLTGVALFILGGALLAWSWNTVAGELFGMPPMSFRHAVAAGTLIAVPGWLLAAASRSHLSPRVPNPARRPQS